MQKLRRSSQETIVQPWVRVLVPPQGIYITIPLSSSVGTKTSTQVEDGKHKMPGTLSCYLTTNQSEESLKQKIMKTLTPSPNDSPFTTFIVEQNFWSWFLDMSPPSPQVASLQNKATFLLLTAPSSQVFGFQAAKSQQPNRSSVTSREMPFLWDVCLWWLGS